MVAQTELRLAEVQPSDAKTVVALWDILPEKDRAALRSLALELRDSLLRANTPEEARNQSVAIIGRESARLDSTISEYLSALKRHVWDDRTWGQRLIVLSFIATLPLTGKAAGLAAFGTAVRVTIPIVGMAMASFVGSGLDVVNSAYKRMAANSPKTGSDHLNRITFDLKQNSGRPCVRSLMSVKDILDGLAVGSSREMILRDHPGLEDADISAALQFAARAVDYPILDASTADQS